MVLIRSVVWAGRGICASADPAAAWFHGRLSPGLTDVLQVLSAPGSDVWVACVVLIVGLVLAWRRSWAALVMLLLAVPGGTLLGEGLKLLVHRVRPYEVGPFGLWGGYSFPSSHTMAATVLYACLTIFLLRVVKGPRRRAGLRAACMVVVLGVGFSRIALGAHHVSDVVGALAMGTVWVILCSACVTMLFRVRDQPVVAGPARHP